MAFILVNFWPSFDVKYIHQNQIKLILLHYKESLPGFSLHLVQLAGPDKPGHAPHLPGGGHPAHRWPVSGDHGVPGGPGLQHSRGESHHRIKIKEI